MERAKVKGAKIEEAREKIEKTQKEKNCMLLGKRRVTEELRLGDGVKQSNRTPVGK